MESSQQSGVTRRSFLIGSAALAASTGLALAGCTVSSSSSLTSSGASSVSSDSAASSGSNASSAPVLKVLRGASAYYSTNYNPIGLNGGAAFTLAATRHVFEGLYDLDMRTYMPYAALAAGAPEKASDVMYEVAIREGACYSDGSPVTAADVANTFEKNKADATVGPLLEFIESISALDERRVSIVLKCPFEGVLESRLSLVKVFPAAREAELGDLPIGSGPWAYAPESLGGGKTIMFKPNAYYNGPLPAQADSMIWSAMNEAPGMRATALRDRAVQVAESISDGEINRLVEAGATVEFVKGFSQAFLMFNTLRRPFADKLVRQAVLYGIDVQRLVDKKLDGHAFPLTSFLPEWHSNYHRASTVYEHDPLRAKALLVAAGVSNLEFTLLVNNNWVADLADFIVEDLKDVGVSCKVKEESIRWDEFSDTDKVLSYDVVLAAGDPSCFGNDPDLLMSWWYGDNVWTRGRSCWARDANGSFAEMQGLLQQARECVGEERQELWNQCFDIIADEVPLYGLFHREVSTGWQADSIKGFHPLAVSGLDFLGCTPA